jgi:hypothetical protein
MRGSLVSIGVAMWLGTGALAQVTIPDSFGVRNPNRGSDEILNVTTNTVIDLGLASTGAWDAPGAIAGRGVYDPSKWAVVFKYQKVTVANGATVTFTNHPSGAPVVWLVDGDAVGDGDVTISGAVSLDGSSYTLGWQGANTGFAPAGPGGFNSGFHLYTAGQAGSGGFGPGGGRWNGTNGSGGSGSHATAGTQSSGPIYWAHPDAMRCLPLVGGSGGSSAFSQIWRAGGAGGGAILIAARATVTLNGTGAIRANGGDTANEVGLGGAGGSVRIVADRVIGSGCLSTTGSNGGGTGRRRIEVRTELNLPCWVTAPSHSTQGTVPTGVAQLWPAPANDFKVKIVSIAGRAVPAEPLRRHTFPNTDLSLPVAGPSGVIIETQNVTNDKVVRLRIRRKSGAEMPYAVLSWQSHDAVRNVDIWSGNVQFPLDVSFVQAEVLNP